MRTERRQREVETMHQQNLRLRDALSGLLELVLAIQEINPALFIPSLDYNQRVMVAKDALLNTPSEGPSKIKLPDAPASGGGPISSEDRRRAVYLFFEAAMRGWKDEPANQYADLDWNEIIYRTATSYADAMLKAN